MKRFFFITGFLPVILLLIAGCQSSFSSDKLADIDRISKKWVPDQREGICSVTVTKGKGGTLILRGETTVPQAKDEIIKVLKSQNISLIDSILLLPDTSKSDKCWGLASLSVITLRKEPDHAAEMASQEPMGTPVLVLKDEDSWILVQTPDRYIGWTEKSCVTLFTKEEIENWKREERLIYLENSGSIYSSVDESGIVSDIVAGCIFVKTGESKDYLKIEFPDGREGYVKEKAVMDFNIWKSKVSGTEENVCRTALKFNGLPYLWGASSPKAVDCSGLAKSVYFMNGIILARDASLQAEHGLSVNISDGYGQLKKGDLLFFGSGSHVSHVAIYIGDSEYIHASGRVRISSLDSTRTNYSKYRKSSFLIARRIIGSANDQGIVPVRDHKWY
ncbi:MAG: C40 family peptidase [Bacteroidales bacterium]|nr:C40 family peptidase [Bacteroidales bacterium]